MDYNLRLVEGFLYVIVQKSNWSTLSKVHKGKDNEKFLEANGGRLGEMQELGTGGER